MHRSYLFAPGHNAKLPAKVFDAGADAAMLDLEDAVPPDAEQVARAMVAEVLAEREGLGSDQRRAQPGVRGLRRLHLRAAQADLEVVAGVAAGIRIPKVESAEDAQWVADRAADTPPICAIEAPAACWPQRRSRPSRGCATCPWAASICDVT